MIVLHYHYFFVILSKIRIPKSDNVKKGVVLKKIMELINDLEETTFRMYFNLFDNLLIYFFSSIF